MQRDTVLSTLKQHQTELKSLGVRSLALFGSVARDEATSTSDVDILVEFEPPITFDRYMDVKLYLEDHLGSKVDLVSRKSLKPQIRTLIEQEMIHVP
ncbi:nucleotidyltransferase family protein [Oscillatoria sp. FACHB-1407]|uniref:nucleotidyltransferase family protein n=1 Tax=Oscillatoria sp. FACHB-1407 TaxID=2692847 RepID=UPI001684C467|nr:nucleotidyltransferase family protein [Oscillatoria sp. FACHB-1407]MBD2464394.1 nucleotidyltransferase family protein [Oscillatoria sp. FACHB-1407]